MLRPVFRSENTHIKEDGQPVRPRLCDQEVDEEHGVERTAGACCSADEMAGIELIMTNPDKKARSLPLWRKGEIYLLVSVYFVTLFMSHLRFELAVIAGAILGVIFLRSVKFSH